MDTSLISIIIIAIALAMDAFSVSLTKGFTQKNLTKSQILYYGLFFGFFQFIMPVIGYICGTTISSFVSTVAPWIAFFLLLAIGLNMIRESLDSDDEYIMDTFSFKELTLLAVATSIDAFAVGITFAFLKVNIIPAVIFIGIITLIISMCGVKIGNIFGDKFKSKAELLGGIILICIGLKILLEHTGII